MAMFKYEWYLTFIQILRDVLVDFTLHFSIGENEGNDFKSIIFGMLLEFKTETENSPKQKPLGV